MNTVQVRTSGVASGFAVAESPVAAAAPGMAEADVVEPEVTGGRSFVIGPADWLTVSEAAGVAPPASRTDLHPSQISKA